MILLYCSDIEIRIKVHGYFRDRGILTEPVPLAVFGRRSYASDAEAILMIGDIPPGYFGMLNPHIPVISVGRYQIGDSLHFRDYESSELEMILRGYSSGKDFFEYNDVLFAKSNEIIFLGYRLKLSPTQRVILQVLIENKDSELSADELIARCTGDIHFKTSDFSKYISDINRKAFNIGGREMICVTASGYYKINKYI